MQFPSSERSLALDNSERHLAVMNPHAQGVAVARGEIVAALAEDPFRPAERVAMMVAKCPEIIAALLGSNRDHMSISVPGFGDLEIQSHGYAATVTVRREMTTQVFCIDAFGQITTTSTTKYGVDDGSGRFGSPAEGAQLYQLLVAAKETLQKATN